MKDKASKKPFQSKQEPVFEVPKRERIDVTESKPVEESSNVEKTREKQLGGITGKGFMPGVSGNPAGRPPGSVSITELIKKKLTEEVTLKDGKSKKQFVMLLLDRILDKAINQGDEKTIKLIWNYVDGLPKGSFDVTSLGEKLEGVVILPAKKEKE